jgi:hypothetical protein
LYRSLPSEVRDLADQAYARRILGIPHFTSRRSVGSGLYGSALIPSPAVDASDGLVWFWIGRHGDYDRLLG